MRISLYIILLAGAVLGACGTNNRPVIPDLSQEFAGSDSTELMYYHCIMYRDTSYTPIDSVIYSAYEMSCQYKCPPGFFNIHCYSIKDTVYSWFDFNYDKTETGKLKSVSFVFINTPTTFRILCSPEAMPKYRQKANDFGLLMKYIKTQEKELPTARFIGHSIDPTQEFTGWQYEFEKNMDKERQNVILTDNDGFFYRLRMPEGVRLLNLPPFLFADFRNFAEICLPTLSDWDWNLYHEPD